MALDFFTWWVGSLWGTGWMAFFGTGLIFYLIGLLSKMGRHLLTSLMILYILVFGSGFFGSAVWLIAALAAAIDFALAIYTAVASTE